VITDIAIDPFVQNDTWTCFARVAAWITGSLLQEVFDFIGHDGSGEDPTGVHPHGARGFHDQEILAFLLSHDYMLSFTELRSGPVRWNRHALEAQPECVLTVLQRKLLRADGSPTYHAIYWDGRRLRDPVRPNEVNIEPYEITHTWTVRKLERYAPFSISIRQGQGSITNA